MLILGTFLGCNFKAPCKYPCAALEVSTLKICWMENYNCHLVIWSGIITLVFATEFLWNENGYLNFGQSFLHETYCPKRHRDSV